MILEVIIAVLAVIGALRVLDLAGLVVKALVWYYVYPKKTALWNDVDKAQWENATIFGLLKAFIQ